MRIFVLFSLVLQGSYHYWTYFVFSPGAKKQMEGNELDSHRPKRIELLTTPHLSPSPLSLTGGLRPGAAALSGGRQPLRPPGRSAQDRSGDRVVLLLPQPL